ARVERDGHRRLLICVVPQEDRGFCPRRGGGFGRRGGRRRRQRRGGLLEHRREVEYRGEALLRILTQRAGEGVAHGVRDEQGHVSRGSGLQAFERQCGERVLVGGRPRSERRLACPERAGDGEVAQQRNAIRRHHHVREL